MEELFLGTEGWKNYSGVQKVGRIILVYRRLEELFWCIEEEDWGTEGWKSGSFLGGLVTGSLVSGA